MEALPPEERGEIREIVATKFSGLLPPPELYRAYDEIVPGAAERLLALSEKEQAHRHDWETNALKGEVRYGTQGLWLGAGSLVVDLLATAYCATIGQPQVAITVAGVGMAGVIGAFIKGRRFSHEGKSGKQEVMKKP